MRLEKAIGSKPASAKKESDWNGLDILGNDWTWLKMSGHGWKCIQMAEHCFELPEMAHNGQKRLEIVGNKSDLTSPSTVTLILAVADGILAR